jgi:DNA processing protein
LPVWEQAVAVVGTRVPDERGVALAAAVVNALAILLPKLVVVSGLAPGIDSAAHRAALACGVPTVAVVGCDLDRVSDGRLADEIVARGGAVLSEYHDDAAENAERRIARDRIQSGLSIATVVVQTEADGGSMHTALACLMQQRLLCAITPPSDEDVWTGNAFLTRRSYGDFEREPALLQPFERFAAVGESLAVPIDAARLADKLAVLRSRT